MLCWWGCAGVNGRRLGGGGRARGRRLGDGDADGRTGAGCTGGGGIKIDCWSSSGNE